MSTNKYLNTDYSKVQSIAGVRKPCMCLKELSKERQVPYSTLTKRFNKSTIAPPLVLSRGITKYYHIDVLNKWFELAYN